MISVNPGIRIFVPEKIEKEGGGMRYMFFYHIRGDIEWEGADTMKPNKGIFKKAKIL